jgi:predicted nucleic acid-binding protein
MMQYLLDTNIILRFCNAADAEHTLMVEAIDITGKTDVRKEVASDRGVA